MASVSLTGFEGRRIDVQTGLFIHGEFSAAFGNAVLEVENPTSGQILAAVSACQREDVDRAVESAKTAFSSWRKAAPRTRALLLNRLADLVERSAPDLASLQTLESGQLYRESLGLHVTQAVETLRYFAGWADKLDGESISLPDGIAYTRREPIGVCAAIVPWNTLMIAFWKLAPAIAAGNVLILKTPETTPLWGQKLAELVKESGFPPGVINILCGYGNVAGQALSEHMAVKKIAFTGSPAVGRRIMAIAAQTNLKKISLELGGKSPSIVFDDADWENALFWTTLGITASNGQVCVAGSRIYVQDTIYERFLSDFSSRSKAVVAGDPFSPQTTKAAIASKAQLDKMAEYVEKGKRSGARLLHGGHTIPGEGYLIENTAFADVRQDADIMTNEVFGPLASIASFSTEEEAIDKANDSAYGLSAAIFTRDLNKAFRVSEALESGQVTVNSWGDVSANAPFGGMKESGFGKDMGKEALDDWTITKTVKWHIQPPSSQ
ncbi:aldehyde dehydrogenase domain-containing protein [Diaporthe sp. PMI_573]|nr:aldehyde dehydrogenase domain-containing protein [Diaporthaceae sp. PMI_573]